MQVVKKVVIVILFIILFLLIYLLEESIRLDQYKDLNPLIVISENNCDFENTKCFDDDNIFVHKQNSFGYSLITTYYYNRKNSSYDVFSKEFKLFKRYTLWSWIF